MFRVPSRTLKSSGVVGVPVSQVEGSKMGFGLKYICQNVEEGFMFAGDTAQTIARGIDFRFQDIRSLFYRVPKHQNNWRTTQRSFDKLEPEICLISGEALRSGANVERRARDTMWEKLAKAYGLRASAYQMRGTNHEAFEGYLREAALIFESIGKLELSATCYCDLGERIVHALISLMYHSIADIPLEISNVIVNRAVKGKIYMHKCGKFDAAAECVTVAGYYSEAAEAYAKGDHFFNCISVCKRGKLFDKGLQYINYWKEHVIFESKEFEEVEQEFLESCALDFHEHEDSESMMKFVRAFRSMESRRMFLRSLGCLDKLLLLEEESGHFLEAADSLWGNGNRGWPLKEFAQKEELYNKVKLLAKMDSDVMHNFVCSELKILSDQHNSLPELKKDLYISQNNSSLRGEILSIRKILDKHVRLNSSKYDWEDNLPHILNIFRSIESTGNEEPITQSGHADFCLYYFGVRKQRVKGNMVYLSLNKDADWIRNTGNKGLHRDEKRIHFDGRELVFAIQSYWQSELLSVGIKVLETLDALCRSKSNGSAFHQSTSLLHIFEVSKFLLDFQYHDLTNLYKKKLQNFLDISLSYFDLVFPLDWRNVVSENMVSLRETDLSVKLLDEIILKNVDIKGELSYWTIGRVLMIFLCSRKQLKRKSITGLRWKPKWKSFVEELTRVSDFIIGFMTPLQDAFLHRENPGHISPHSFMHLLDRFLFLTSFYSGILFTTKASFVEWFTHLPSTDPTFPEILQIYTENVKPKLLGLFVNVIQQILCNKEDTESWIRRSKINVSCYLPLLALRLVMLVSLICLQEPDYSKVLLDLLTLRKSIGYLLPKKFSLNLQSRRSGYYWNLNPEVVAEAFKSIEDPLLIVYLGDAIPKIHAPYAIFVDLKKPKQEIMSLLLPRKYKHIGQTSSNNVGIGTTPTSNALPDVNTDINRVELQLNWKVVEEISEAINGNKGMAVNTLATAAMIKDKIDKNIGTLATILVDQKICSGKDAIVVRDAYEHFGLLSSAFDKSQQDMDNSTFKEGVVVSLKKLQSNRLKIDEFLSHYVINLTKRVGDEASEVLENQTECDNNTHDDNNKKGKENHKGKKSKKNKGKKEMTRISYRMAFFFVYSRCVHVQ
ncbi:UvrD-like helicase, ATP-binding domain, P-loop containing nucleoside triphosphate hydrolase [Tanacetum coccineum]